MIVLCLQDSIAENKGGYALSLFTRTLERDCLSYISMYLHIVKTMYLIEQWVYREGRSSLSKNRFIANIIKLGVCSILSRAF